MRALTKRKKGRSQIRTVTEVEGVNLERDDSSASNTQVFQQRNSIMDMVIEKALVSRSAGVEFGSIPGPFARVHSYPTLRSGYS